MTLEYVLQVLIQRLGSRRDCTLGWEETREWPEGAVSVFQKAGWIKPASFALMVECPGCEENCCMPVHVFSTQSNQPARAYVACDRRDDVGRVKVPLNHLLQWQITQSQVARWISMALNLKGKPQKQTKSGVIKLGHLLGRERAGSIELDPAEKVCLKVSGYSLPLSEAIFFEDGHPKINHALIIDLVDRPPQDEIPNCYQPSRVKREARKLDTQTMYKSWQKAYREQKRERPLMSDVWHSQQIAKMEIAKGRNSETIRRKMKK